MSAIEFRGRPVAALAVGDALPRRAASGRLLELEVDARRLRRRCGGLRRQGQRRRSAHRRTRALPRPDVAGADFDAPEALRERFALLCGDGAAPDRFTGVDLAQPVVTEHVPAQIDTRACCRYPSGAVLSRSLSATARIPGDADARRADASRATLAGESPLPAAGPLSLRRMTNVKVRSFTTPGQAVELGAEATPQDDGTCVSRCPRVSTGKTVATARVEFGAGHGRSPQHESASTPRRHYRASAWSRRWATTSPRPGMPCSRAAVAPRRSRCSMRAVFRRASPPRSRASTVDRLATDRKLLKFANRSHRFALAAAEQAFADAGIAPDVRDQRALGLRRRHRDDGRRVRRPRQRAAAFRGRRRAASRRVAHRRGGDRSDGVLPQPVDGGRGAC